MVKILYILVSILAFTSAIFIVAGYTSKEEYTGSIEFSLDSNIEFVWQELIDVTNAAKRKKDVESVEVIEQYGKLSAWQENLKNGGYRIYRMNEFIPNQKLSIELTESSYGLTGYWSFELYDQNRSSTRILISERSALTNLPLRGIRTIFGRDYDLLVWLKYIRVGVIQTLLITP